MGGRPIGRTRDFESRYGGSSPPFPAFGNKTEQRTDTPRPTEARVLGAVILAAGASKRFKSDRPKVLHDVWGRPLVSWTLSTLAELDKSVRPTVVCVVHSQGVVLDVLLEKWRDVFKILYAIQAKPGGTGDAAQIGLSALPGLDEVIVLAGDSPLVRSRSIAKLVRQRRSKGAPVSLLVSQLENPSGYGRILRTADGRVSRIVEEKNASADERAISEINASAYVFDAKTLKKLLLSVRPNQKTNERYLTDVVEKVAGAIAVTGDPSEVIGANTRVDFANVTMELRQRILMRLLKSGVTIIDPPSVYVDADVIVKPDTVLMPGVHLEGRTVIQKGCEIGPNSRLIDTTVGHGSTVTYSVASGAVIGRNCTVGPFASLRPGTELKDNSKVGTFVETKNASIGKGSKVPHLSYMGDVSIGTNANIGAGTITCNYDGKTKHKTTIGDDAFIGSNTMLVAPVKVGKGAKTGAGSVVTRDVEDGETVAGAPARKLPHTKPKTKTRKNKS